METEITDLAAWKTGDGKIGKTGHNFVYSASGNVITATCKNNNEHKVTLTLTKNTLENYYVYDNSAKTVDFSVGEAVAWTGVGLELPTITYTAKSGSTLTDGKAVNAGSYTAKVTVTYDGDKTVTAEKAFTVKKAEQIISADAEQNFTYGDTGKFVGASATGALSFAVKSGESVTVSAAGALTIQKIGDTVITITAAATDNYNSTSKDITVKIGAKAIDKPTATTTNFVYTGEEQTYLPTGFDADTMDIAGNKQTNANETGYTVTVTPKANYVWSTEGDCKLTWIIGKKVAQLQWTTPTDLVYSNSAKVPTVAVTNLESGDSCTVTAGLTAEDDNINVGTFTFTATALSNGNYKLPDDVTSPEYTITKTSQDAPAEGEGYTVDYVNEKITPDSGYEVSTTSGDDFVTGKLSGETDIVFGTTYYVRKAADANHNASEGTHFSFTRPAAVTGVTAQQETIVNKDDAYLRGVTGDMEYRIKVNGGTYGTWITGDGTSIGFKFDATPDPITHYDVEVRTKATATAFAGKTTTFTFLPNTTDKLTVTMGATSAKVAYDSPVTKPADPTRTGYTFGGWYTDEACTQAWNFGDGVTKSMTLYPKWIKNAVQKAAISGKVTEGGENVPGATVELYLGVGKIAAATTDASGNYSFDNVENGTYNIVVTKGEKAKTSLVTVNSTGSFSANVELPAKDVSSKVEHKGTAVADAKSDIKETVVGGLDAIASDTDAGANKVTIKLTVEPKAESDVASASDIKALAGSGKKVEFLDLSLWEITTTDSGELIGDIGNANSALLTIVIPFDFSGVNVSSVMILRQHGTDNVEKLTKNPAAGQEGFTVNATEGTITIYAKKFSTYAMAYAEQSTGGHGGGSYTTGHTVTSDLNNITKVTIDGKTVDKKYYTVGGGNVVLSGEFMKTLTNGKHTVKLYDGLKVAAGVFTVTGNVAVASAATGDMGVALYAALSVSSMLGMGWLGKKKRGGE